MIGGVDGYEAYKVIVADAHKFLIPGGRLMTEVGFGQSEYISSLFDKYGYKDIQVYKDLSSIDRVVSGRKQ